MADYTRRSIMIKSGLAAVIGIVCYPFFRFLGFTVPAKPRYVRVHTPSTVREFWLEADFILFRGEHESPWAVSRTCTHLGCRLNYDEQEKLLICPCHQSRFTAGGKRISGPATRDLAVYAVEKVSVAQQGNGMTEYIVTL